MKKLRNIILILILAALIFFLLREFVFQSKGQLKGPESIVYDSVNDRFLISNTGSGTIAAMDKDGKITPFVSEGLKSPKGLKIGDVYLYVADASQLRAIDLKTGAISETYSIEGARNLNDIEIDENGIIYLTDTEANALFIYDKNTRQLVDTITDPLLASPNGIAYDRSSYRMLITCFTDNAPILQYDMRDKKISIFRSTLYNQLDGITIVEEHGEGEEEHGAIYFTSWGEQKIYRIPPEQNQIIPLETEYITPADLIYHSPTKELLIPLQKADEISRLKIIK
ncbi:MAG: SMP-30/gluconolactonase/LRE family protein [Candidatus Cloacimonetes bacterium]|nr:SMP-30/gluconolactonase/LRE family protein [Candidatus Cloacimonadota bacterium]